MAYILVLILAAAALVLAALLVRLLRQLNTWADLLESTGADSNLRLPAALRLRPVLRSCRAINGRLDQAQQRALQARRSGEELQSAMAAVSHDIRTPLAAAGGYLELAPGTGPGKAEKISGHHHKTSAGPGNAFGPVVFVYAAQCGRGGKGAPRSGSALAGAV